MKNRYYFWFLVYSSAGLTACTFGNGRICGPQTPVAYCDKDVLQKLLHPKSYVESWEKPGMTIEGRMEDWRKCGGYKDGSFSPRLKDFENENRQGESGDLAAYSRLNEKLRRCMAESGYHYVGS